MFRLIVSSIVVITLVFTLTLAAQLAPKDSDVSVSPMTVRTLKDCTFLYRSIETDMQNSAQRIEAEMKSLAEEIKSAKIMAVGSPIFVFQNPTPEAGKTFTIEMGFPVAAETKAPASSKVRSLEPFRAATVMFSGPMPALRGAYEQLYQQISQAGLTPGTELRQYTLYWESVDSPNNVMLLQVGLEK